MSTGTRAGRLDIPGQVLDRFPEGMNGPGLLRDRQLWRVVLDAERVTRGG